MRRDGGTWTAFLIAAFAVVALVGSYATYAAQIPFERALARSATLDRAVAIAHGPEGAHGLESLRGLLGDSADVIIGPAGGNVLDIDARANAERRRVFAEMGAEASDIGFRLRIVIAAFAAAAALFGAAIVSILSRGPAAFSGGSVTDAL